VQHSLGRKPTAPIGAARLSPGSGSNAARSTGRYHAIVWTLVHGHLVPEEKPEEFINPASALELEVLSELQPDPD